MSPAAYRQHQALLASERRARELMRGPLTRAEAIEILRAQLHAAASFGSATVVIGRSTAKRLIELLREVAP